MTRFTPTDLDLAHAADQFLIDACRQLATIAALAAQELKNLEAAGPRPEEALAALQHWRRFQARLRDAEDRILALLLMRGATRRGLADAIGVRPETITARTASHRAAAATRADIRRDTAGRWEWIGDG